MQHARGSCWQGLGRDLLTLGAERQVFHRKLGQTHGLDYTWQETSVNTNGVTWSDWESALRNLGKDAESGGGGKRKVSLYKKITFLSPTTGPAHVCPSSGNRRGYRRRADETDSFLQLATLALPHHSGTGLGRSEGILLPSPFISSIRLKDTRFNHQVRSQRAQGLRGACKGSMGCAS